jgi:hypothetical protein
MAHSLGGRRNRKKLRNCRSWEGRRKEKNLECEGMKVQLKLRIKKAKKTEEGGGTA